MTDLELPAESGLAIGIAFIVVLSLMYTPAASSSQFHVGSIDRVDEKIIAEANKLKEAQVFFSEYPEGEAKIYRIDKIISEYAVTYSYQKVYEDGMANQVRMFVMLDEKTSKPTGEIYVDCAVWSVIGVSSGKSTSSSEPDITKVLQTTGCAR